MQEFKTLLHCSDIVLALVLNRAFPLYVILSFRSPVTVRRAASRHSSTSPEKSPAKRLPPRNPRSQLRKSSRASSSSPDKIVPPGESRKELAARAASSSPSPVRSQAPVPSPSVELCYTSSFPSSSSLSSSPSKSPSKTGCKKVEQASPVESSIHTECAGSPPGGITRSPPDCDLRVECSLSDGSGSDSGHQSRRSLAAKRRSWVGSSVRGGGSSGHHEVGGDQDPPRQASQGEQQEGAGTAEAKQKVKPAGKPKQVQLATRRPDKSDKPKPRPVSVRKRPQSAPNKKVLKTEPAPIADLGEYSKSLKLVGVDVPSNRTEATKIKNQEIQVKTKEPTFKTRILRRSGSYADLTKQINQGMKKTDFESVKSELNKAIFENWYFNKFHQGKSSK